jgi:sialidase-1
LKNKILAVLFISFLFTLSSKGQTTNKFEPKVDRWFNCERSIFSFEEKTAWLVKPAHPLPGNPWIWKAYFPDWHTDVDSVLLSRGFHLAYIEANDLFGNATAMQLWDKFYSYLVHVKRLAPKVALEGISRGGLYVYNWAKRNPLKVSCIYAEAPVLNFTSWPGGKGISKGSAYDWELLLKAYNLTEEQALAFNDQPYQHTDGLAACKIPLLHAIGLQDKIVPPAENTELLFNQYTKLGGITTFYPMTRGKQNLEGHHFTIEHPESIADFIQSNSSPVMPVLDPALFHNKRNALQHSYSKFITEKKGTVAFMGGSITEWGAWREKVCTYLKEKFPETAFEFINAGISSTGSLPGAFRLENDVLSKGKIDLFFEEAAVNDQANSTSDKQQIKGMEGIVRHALNSNPLMDIVLMYFVDPEKIKDYTNGIIPKEIINHELIAANYQISSINLAKEVTERIRLKEFTWEEDFKDLHPSIFGHEVYFRSIKTFLESCYNSTQQHTANQSIIPSPININAYYKGKYVAVDQAILKTGFELVNNWRPDDLLETRKQYVNIPAVVSNQVGAELRFNFKGTAVGICINAGPDAGIIHYTIDGKEYTPVDLFTQWSSSLHLPWYIILADDLKDKNHTLIIKNSSQKNIKSIGNSCRIVHFLVN